MASTTLAAGTLALHIDRLKRCLRLVSPSCLLYQRLADLSKELREFIALEHAQVLPISAHTGYGLDKLRAALVNTLGCESGSSEDDPTIKMTQNTEVDGMNDRISKGNTVVEGPERAATGTVLDYVNSAKTGKMLVSNIFNSLLLL